MSGSNDESKVRLVFLLIAVIDLAFDLSVLHDGNLKLVVPLMSKVPKSRCIILQLILELGYRIEDIFKIKIKIIIKSYNRLRKETS